jgi:branched-chain amino acid transport system permease protein
MVILNTVIDGLLMGGLYALIAMGLSLQYGVARVFNISHGEFIMIGAFATWVLYTVCGVNPLVSLVIVGPVVFIIGLILHRTLFHTLSVKAPNPDAYVASSLLATFGLLFIIQNIALQIWGNATHSYLYLSSAINIGGISFATNRLVIFGFAVGIGLAFYIFLVRTRMGKAIRAAAQDPVMAGLMGVNISRVLAICFGLGALMAGVAGSLASMSVTIQATMGLNYTIVAVVVVVLGGLGSIPGSFIGGLIIGLINSFMSYYEPGLSVAAYYALFIILLLVRPKGILGK